eukprot:3013473-Pleurochrysis_carterae.AAC.2
MALVLLSTSMCACTFSSASQPQFACLPSFERKLCGIARTCALAPLRSDQKATSACWHMPAREARACSSRTSGSSFSLGKGASQS